MRAPSYEPREHPVEAAALPATIAQLGRSERAQLIAMLEAHAPRDAKERADRDRIRAFVERHDDAHLRANPLGHLTGSAFVLDPPQQRVLLTHHRKLDRWLQLGGHGEGEWDPAGIALREAHEESGLDTLRFHACCAPPRPGALRAPLDVDIHTIPARGEVAAHEHLDLRYVLLADDANERRCAEESNALHWFGIEEALALPGLDASLQRALQTLLELVTL